MRETVEFRIVEEYAPLLFAPTEGERLGGMVRRVVMDADDPRIVAIGELDEQLVESENRSLFYSWNISRAYSKQELDRASLLHAIPEKRFEPTGEQAGTIYDKATECLLCGSGARQRGPLKLSSLPRGRYDVASTVANELIVSRRAVEVFIRSGLSGSSFGPVILGSCDKASLEWFQLQVTCEPALITERTRSGVSPFDRDEDGRYRCGTGHLLGLALLSEIYVDARSLSGCDYVVSDKWVGVRRGYLRPQKPLMVSQRVRTSVQAAGLRGWRFEVVHIE
jgi:hypothetical protein